MCVITWVYTDVYQSDMIIYVWGPTFNVTIRKTWPILEPGSPSQFVGEDRELTKTVNVPLDQLTSPWRERERERESGKREFNVLPKDGGAGLGFEPLTLGLIFKWMNHYTTTPSLKAPPVLLVATCSLYIENFPNRCLLVPMILFFLCYLRAELMRCQWPRCVV